MATNLEGTKLQCELGNYLASLLLRATVPANCSANCAACRGVKLLAVACCLPCCALALAGCPAPPEGPAARRTGRRRTHAPSPRCLGTAAPHPRLSLPSQVAGRRPPPHQRPGSRPGSRAVVGSRMGLASQTSAGDDPLHPPATDVFVLTQHRPLAARRRLWPLEDNARLLG